MRRQTRFLIIGALCVMTMLSVCSLAIAQDAPSIEELQKKIEMLQSRVDELEKEKEPGPTMPCNQKVRSDRFGSGWDPFEEMRRMQGAMDVMFQDLFDRSGSVVGTFSSDMSFDSAVNMNQTEDEYIIEFNMTGMDPDNIDIQINPHAVTVKGEYSAQEKQESQDQYVQVQSFGSFMKTIPLPKDADTSRMKTEKHENTLLIHLPRKK